jgi:methylmalonyl-CoA mutase
VPPKRVRYLAEIADTVRGYHRRHAFEQARIARERQQRCARRRRRSRARQRPNLRCAAAVEGREARPFAKKLLEMWPDMQKAYAGDEYVVKIRDKEIRTGADVRVAVRHRIRKVALPKFDDTASCCAS